MPFSKETIDILNERFDYSTSYIDQISSTEIRKIEAFLIQNAEMFLADVLHHSQNYISVLDNPSSAIEKASFERDMLMRSWGALKGLLSVMHPSHSPYTEQTTLIVGNIQDRASRLLFSLRELESHFSRLGINGHNQKLIDERNKTRE